MQKEKTTPCIKEETKKYLEEEIMKCVALVRRYTKARGRVNRDLWFFHMGKLCVYQQMLDFWEDKT